MQHGKENKMTVSQRASQIYKLTKPSGGTWQQAMADAYEDIAREEMEREEQIASDELENLAQAISDAYNRARIFAEANDLIAEIIVTAIDNGKSKYPASAIMRKLNAYGMGNVQDLVFWSSDDVRYNSRYRMSNGKISSEWWSNISALINALNVNPSDLDNYDVVSAYFV